MVSITGGPRLPTVGTGPGNVPARVSGPRQNQNHQNPPPALAARAPLPGHGANPRASHRAPAATASSTPVLAPTERVRKSLDNRSTPHEQAESPLDQLTADLQALALQHAAAMQEQPLPAQAQQPLQASHDGHSQQARERDGHRPAPPSRGSSSSNLQDAGLPPQLVALQNPAAPVALPPPGSLPPSCLDNWKLDKLVAALGRDRSTWRRAMLLFEWLKASRHAVDDRLCTTLIRVCADHGDCVGALGVYEWMTAPLSAGGAALTPTTYTYTAAMRAALAGHLHSRALHIWNDAWRQHQGGQLALDARLCITYIELCARMGLTDQAMGMYAQMLAAPAHSRLAPTVHAFTAAMRAATEGGRWMRALEIWEDMRRAGCEPTGHAYAAAISACAAGGDWLRAVAFFEEMAGQGIKPDVVSCTALISALAAAGEADKAESVLTWMLANGVRPNARTYTAVLSALANAKQWARAVETLSRMRQPEWGGVEPNAYTYSALLKSLGEHGHWQLAEAVFSGIEQQVLGDRAPSPASAAAAVAAAFPSSASSSVQGLAAAAAGLMSHAISVAAMSAPSALSGSAPDMPVRQASPAPSASSFTSSSSDAGSSMRSWTHPSQLHGLNLDLNLGMHGTSPVSAGPAGHDAATGRRSFSLFSHPASSRSSASSAASVAVSEPLAATVHTDPWRATLDVAGAQTLSEQLSAPPAAAAASAAAVMAQPPPPPPRVAGGPQRSAAPAPSSPSHHGHHHHHSNPEHHIVNEVVCGALMLAYERAGKWQEAVNVLLRALNLGITPNTVMYNTAISAAGKAGQLEVAERLYAKVRSPDAVTHETMIAAYGVAGMPDKAEGVFTAMTAAGFRPRDYAFCGLIAAHSLGGDWEGALRMRARMRRAGSQPSVHVYNALLAACERAAQPDKALELVAAMKRDGVEANAVTHQLLAAIGRQGVQTVESQQVAAAALSAAVAAYGTLLIQTGLF